MTKKKRIEIQLDPVKDEDIINFLETHGSTNAGAIRFILRQYINMFNRPVVQPEPTRAENSIDRYVEPPKQQKKAANKKRLPQLGESFSSSDFSLDDDN